MFFYDDFIKKVEKAKVDYKPLKKYTLEGKKMIVWLGTGIPLVLIGVLQGYMKMEKWLLGGLVTMVLGIMVIVMGNLLKGLLH